MKENTPTPEDVSIPPPLTPKDSLSEVEEIKERAGRDISYDESRNHIHRLLVVIDEYDEQLAKESRFWSQSCAHLSQENKYLQAQLRRKDEALERSYEIIKEDHEILLKSIHENADLKGLLKSSLAVAQQEAEAAQADIGRYREALELAMGGLRVYADLTDKEKGTRYWAEHIIKEIKTAGV